MFLKLEVGDVFRWRNYGVGNNFCSTRIWGYHPRKLLRRAKWELETWIEPSGFPKFGSLYHHPQLTGKVSESDFDYITSYGILAEVHRPTPAGLVQVWPEVVE